MSRTIRPYGHKIAIFEFGRIMNRHYKTLELDKILERLAGMTSIEDAREMALNLEPVFELKKVEQLLQQTDDAVAYAWQKVHKRSNVFSAFSAHSQVGHIASHTCKQP